MKYRSGAGATWAAASLATPADTSPVELASLGDHLARCDGLRGRWFALRCLREAVDRFAAPRFVSTLMLFALIGIVSGWMF